MGRNDEQVKIRGFRIEPGEIAARLAEHALVREAVVVAREDRRGDKHLVGYVVCAAEAASNGPDGDALAGALRAHVSAHLPDYMVPSAFVRIAALPLTPNGKLDRQALPAPEDEAYARRSYEPPQGEIETALAKLWAELLGLERVGRHDHFFELGGHSLLAVQLLSRAVDLGLKFSAADIFQAPVLKELASKVHLEPQPSSSGVICVSREPDRSRRCSLFPQVWAIAPMSLVWSRRWTQDVLSTLCHGRHLVKFNFQLLKRWPRNSIWQLERSSHEVHIASLDTHQEESWLTQLRNGYWIKTKLFHSSL
ncbi:hypothetical protein AWV80_08160 [Cupriavidus sp. UYMU48A]|nr:hypothetical protein AWV80_08160 [Cupriavidus sp. UYMU48A]